MIEVKSKENCCGCHSCYSICPKNAIMMIEDENGFKVPKVDKEKCIECKLCEKVCPIINSREIENKSIISYAMYNLEENTRLNSSSGGIFSLIAEEILNLDGVVFGAEFDENFNVRHNYMQKEEDLNKFRSSKYVQSTIGDTYKKAKEFLDNDRYVLFTGTPCQIEGLKAYLQKDYNKLYTQDIVCHGVPAPSAWREYLKYRNINDLKKISKVNFRDKKNGWEKYSLALYGDKKSYSMIHTKDLYMQAYLRNICLRESCYNCKFKKKNRISDITLADFWGINIINKQFNDHKGTSLVLLNSKKGIELFENIKSKTKYQKVDLDEVIKYNKSMLESAEKPKKRSEFLNYIKSGNFKMAVNKYTDKPKNNNKIKLKIKRILARLFNK